MRLLSLCEAFSGGISINNSPVVRECWENWIFREIRPSESTWESEREHHTEALVKLK